jgi:hypothetical protein
MHTAIEELLETVFSVLSMPKLYKRGAAAITDWLTVSRNVTLTYERVITAGFLDFVHRPEFYKQEFRMMDKVQKPSSNECYTPSSEFFRIYERVLRWQLEE